MIQLQLPQSNCRSNKTLSQVFFVIQLSNLIEENMRTTFNFLVQQFFFVLSPALHQMLIYLVYAKYGDTKKRVVGVVVVVVQ